MTQNRSEQQLEDDGTSVAPPQRLRSQTALQPQPLSGSSRQRVEIRATVTADDESESIDENETDEDDENDSRKGDDDSVQGAKKKSGYVFPDSFPSSRGFFLKFQHLPLLSSVLFLFLFQFFCCYGYFSPTRRLLLR
jgi:hypothetical protein